MESVRIRPVTIALMGLAILFSVPPSLSRGAPLSPGFGNFQALKAAAEAGNASAENALGNLDYEGRRGKKNWVQARHEYREAARKGSLAGARNYGWMLWKGEGGTADPKRAEKWLKVAAQGGDPKAMNILGAFYLSRAGGHDFRRAFQSFLQGARAHDPRAMFNVGALYDLGKGVPQSFSRAAHWWRKAAEAGDTTAQTGLGDLYERGQGVPKDYGQANFWYKKAAAAGSSLARESLAVGPWSPILSPVRPRRVASSPVPPSPHAVAKKEGDSPAGKREDRIVPVSASASSSGAPSTGVPVSAEIKGTNPPGAADPGTLKELALLRKEVESLVKERKAPDDPHFETTVDRPDYREPVQESSYAVVVGVEHYPGGVPTAAYADRDAQAMMRHLEALGVPADHIRLLTEALATRGGIDAALRWLRLNAAPGATVYFYYSGHGIPGGKGTPYLAPSGVMAGDLADTAYPLSRLYRGLEAVGAARRLVILDACFAGAGPRSFSGSVRPVFVESSQPLEQGLVVLSAVSGGQESGVIDAKGHGLFTYYLLKGLNGGALQGHHVTLSSLFRYTREHVSHRALLDDREQVPRLISGRGQDAPILLR
ncbi:MAG: caspase family protein [Leptospirillia bacterium]